MNYPLFFICIVGLIILVKIERYIKKKGRWQNGKQNFYI